MAVGQDFVGKPVISVREGKRVGTVKDLFVDKDLRAVVGVYLGTEGGLFSRRGLCVDRANVVVYGPDAVLVKDVESVVDSTAACEAAVWVRRDQVHAQEMMTAGGTRVGTVDDVILGPGMEVVGFSLSRAYVTGPVADKRAVAREAVIEVDVDGAMTVDLGIAEQQELSL